MQMRVSFPRYSHLYPDVTGLHRQFSGVRANRKKDLLWQCDFPYFSLPSILPVTWFYLFNTWLVSQRKSNTS